MSDVDWLGEDDEMRNVAERVSCAERFKCCCWPVCGRRASMFCMVSHMNDFDKKALL